MKKFKYRLEALLKFRQHIEREKQRSLAEAQNQVHQQQGVIGRIEHGAEATLGRKRRHQTASFSSAELQVYGRYLYRLKREAVMAQELLAGLEKNRDEKRQDLMEAARERKIYEKLKERHRDRYRREAIRAATKETDEVGINSYRQKKSRSLAS